MRHPLLGHHPPTKVRAGKCGFRDHDVLEILPRFVRPSAPLSRRLSARKHHLEPIAPFVRNSIGLMQSQNRTRRRRLEPAVGIDWSERGDLNSRPPVPQNSVPDKLLHLIT